MPDTAPTPDSDLNIEQNVKGDQNQTIGQVSGGMVVYGQVIYNNAAVVSDSTAAKAKPAEIGLNPYKGLLTFQETDSDLFFGREPQIKDLWEKLRNLHEEASATRLLTIYGPSGSGKSSLARAGLIPELTRRPLPGGSNVAIMVPGRQPIEALATVLARIATNDKDPAPIEKAEEFERVLMKPTEDGLYDGLRRITQALSKISSSPLILLVDQLDEVFTHTENPTVCDAFMGNLYSATVEGSKQFLVITTLRSDFLGTVQQYPWLDRIIDKQGIYVSAMNREGLREAITKPAELAERPFDLGTVSLLIEQTERCQGALPLLQFALREIWDGLLEGKEPVEKLNEIGGVTQALALKAEKYYDQFNDIEKLQIQRIFIQLLRPDDEAEYTKRIATRDEIGQENWIVVSRLASERLVVTSRNLISNTETVELVHEALIREWPRLTQWLDEHREFRTWQRRLRSAQKEWETINKDDSALLRGVLLTEAEIWLQERTSEIASNERGFIELSIKVRDRSRKLIIRGLMGFSALALALGSIASLGWINAERQSRITKVEGKSLLALRQLELSPIDALIFAMEGGQELKSLVYSDTSPGDYPTIHPILALQTILDKIHLQNQVETFQKGVNSIALNADQTLMATAGGDGKVKLWKRDGTSAGEILAYPNSKINSVRFSPDSKKLATAGENGIAKVWDIRGKLLYEIPAHPGSGVRNIRFGHKESSDLLVTSGYDGRVKLWNKIGQYRGELIDFKNSVKSANKGGVEVVNLSEDDKFILTGGKDKLAKLWNRNGSLITVFSGHTGTVKSAKFHPNKQLIVTAGEDGTIKFWDLNGNLKSTTQADQGGINAVDFYSDQLISAGNYGTIKVWNAQRKNLSKFKAHDGKIESIRVNKDETLITAGQKDGKIKLWKLPKEKEIRLIGHKMSVNSVRFSPDNQQVVTASADGTVRRWDLTGKVLKSFPKLGNIKGGFESVRFINGGKGLLTGGGEDSIVRIWNLDGVKLKEFSTKQGGIHSVNLNTPLDSILSTTGDDKTVKLWKLDGSLIQKLSLKEKVVSTRFSPDGKFIVATGENGMIRLWAIDDGKYWDLEGHKGIVNSLGFSPNGEILATVGADAIVRLWSIPPSPSISVVKLLSSFKTFHGTLHSVNFNPDGKLLATATEDGGVQFWTLSGQQLADFKLHYQKVRSADFSRNGSWFVTASEDGTAIIWKVRDLQELLMQGCSWLKYYLATHPNEQSRLPICSR
jgi:WD40 repeat protein